MVAGDNTNTETTKTNISSWENLRSKDFLLLEFLEEMMLRHLKAHNYRYFSFVIRKRDVHVCFTANNTHLQFNITGDKSVTNLKDQVLNYLVQKIACLRFSFFIYKTLTSLCCMRTLPSCKPL